MNNKKCRGCEVWDNKKDHLGEPMCEFKPTRFGTSCPCLLCLVKMMYCDGCEDYKKYINLMEKFE